MVADTWNGKDTRISLGHSGEMAVGAARDEMLARQQALCGLLVRQLQASQRPTLEAGGPALLARLEALAAEQARSHGR
jgi:hypothetical protein